MNRGAKEPRFSVSMVVWPVLAVIVVALIALGRRGLTRSDMLPVPHSNLAPGHLITSEDLVDRRVDRYGLGNVARSRSAVEGHVTKDAVKHDVPIPRAALTGAVPKDYSGRVLIRFRADHATTVGVTSGDRVRLLFAPTGNDDHSPAPAAIDAVLVDTAEDGDATDYFVAIAAADRDALLERVGRSRLLVTRAR
jgi:hypothetical protein